MLSKGIQKVLSCTSYFVNYPLNRLLDGGDLACKTKNKVHSLWQLVFHGFLVKG